MNVTIKTTGSEQFSIHKDQHFRQTFKDLFCSNFLLRSKKYSCYFHKESNFAFLISML